MSYSNLKPKICVVLLNWNGRDDTLACLDSLERSDYSHLEIVVVDQGSQDGLVGILQQRRPYVQLIVNERNQGFAGGNNQGIRLGLEMGSDYILLLNNDTIVDEACISELVTVAESSPAAGALGPKIDYRHESSRIWSAGGVIDFSENVSRMRGYGRLDRGQFNQLAAVDYISGCAILVPRRTVEVVGLLCEDFYPAYYEDADWGMRIRTAGYVNLFVPSARIWHKGSGSSGGDYNPTSKYLLGYHAVTFMRRHARPANWTRFILFGVFSLPFAWAREGIRGRGVSILAKTRGLRDGFLRRPLSKRYF